MVVQVNIKTTVIQWVGDLVGKLIVIVQMDFIVVWWIGDMIVQMDFIVALWVGDMFVQMDFIVVVWVGYNMGRGHDYTDGLHCSAMGRVQYG